MKWLIKYFEEFGILAFIQTLLFLNSINCTQKYNDDDVILTESLKMTSVIFLAIQMQSLVHDFGHVTCDEIGLSRIRLKPHLLFWYKRWSLIFMAHGSPRMYLWSLTLTQLITEVYHLTTRTDICQFENPIRNQTYLVLSFRIFWIYVKGWGL